MRRPGGSVATPRSLACSAAFTTVARNQNPSLARDPGRRLRYTRCMASRRLLGCLPLVALAVCASTACKDKDKVDVAGTTTSAADLDRRCVQLGKVCGDKGKHVEKIIDECKQAAKKQVENGCTDKVIAAYDCYERELCGSGDKVWTIEDLRLLATRHSKCVAEQDASRACAEKK